MESIVLRKGPFDTYRPDKFEDIPLYSLALFLITDGLPYDGDQSNFWIEFLRDSQNGQTEGDAMEMLKSKNKVFVAPQFRKNPEDYSKAFSTTKEILIDTLLRWAAILASASLPDEIIITQDGNYVSLTPKFSRTTTNIPALSAISLKR